MHRAFIVSLALAICLPSQADAAASSSVPASHLMKTKKPVHKSTGPKKRTNFSSAKLNCKPGKMTRADVIRCGYDF
jgi:hypothetical protein